MDKFLHNTGVICCSDSDDWLPEDDPPFAPSDWLPEHDPDE